MQVTFSCPHCEQPQRVEVAVPGARSSGPANVVCPQCGQEMQTPPDAWDGDRLTRCLVCPSADLFTRKDFPQRLGVLIVVIGFAASCVTWYWYWTNATFVVLFATALLDLLLFLVVGNSVMCYRCGAQYRGLNAPETYGAFHLETHERHRQQKARLAESSAAADRTRRVP